MKGVYGLKKSAAKGALNRVDGLRIDWDEARGVQETRSPFLSITENLPRS